MTRDEIQIALDGVFDQAIVYHGFTDYLRDYEIVFYCTADPSTGIKPAHERLVFKHCVVAEVATAIRPDIWLQSLDDRLIDYATGVDLPGYVWGVKWQANYPGATILDASERAARWEAQLNIPFYELVIETNGHDIRLVFSDLQAGTIEVPYAPHVVGPSGPDYKSPLGAGSE